MSRNQLLYTTTIFVALSAFGCSDSTAPLEPILQNPTFGAVVTGSTSRHLRGGAVFAADVPGFGLALVHASSHTGTDTVKHAIYFRARTAGVPQPGEYTIVSGNYEGYAIEAGVVLDGDGDDPLFCVATAGYLRVLSVSEARIEGRFTMLATCAHVGGEPLEAPLSVNGTFVAARGTLTLPDESIAVAGATYVLTAVDGEPVPHLYRDLDIVDDHLRMRTWIAADTIRFGLDGQLAQAAFFHQLEESTETQEVMDDWSWVSSRGGFFRQSTDRVAVAWAFVSTPTDEQYADTLIVQRDVLVRQASLPPQCLMCPVGPKVAWTYVRQ